MAKKRIFRVLTPEQYERLPLQEKLAYIDEAIRMRKVGAGDARRSPLKAPGGVRK